jgi:hypothetical protein
LNFQFYSMVLPARMPAIHFAALPSKNFLASLCFRACGKKVRLKQWLYIYLSDVTTFKDQL